MSQIRPPDIYELVVKLSDAGQGFALVTVLTAKGPTPAKAGAKAVFREGTGIVGTIGGGAVEAEAMRQAVTAIRTSRPVVFDFNLEGEDAAGRAPVCGGTMRVLVDATAAADHEVYATAVSVRRSRARGVMLTSITEPAAAVPEVRVEFVAEAAIDLWLGFPGPAVLQSAFRQQQPCLIGSPETAGRQREVLVDPLILPPLLLVVGGGHVGQAVAWQADQVGFEVAVIDDRPEFTACERFPAEAIVRCGPMEDELCRFPLNEDTYVVIVTRGHRHDAAALAACLSAPVAYVGMIGSRRKVEVLRKDFLDAGKSTPEAFDRVYAPIGLDIGAVTVPEIAAGIVAQLIAVRRRGTAPRIPRGECP